jgi:selenocysteine lyase/cysteine desulfurase
VIRAGLAQQLKEAIGVDRIEALEHAFVVRAIERFAAHPKIRVLGDPTVPRLGIVSIVIDEGRLHYNLAARILSDRWGIQTRGGCMCAGTYGHELLGIGAARSYEIRCALDQGDQAAKPGWLRISFSPATTEEDFAALLDAVCALADGWQVWAQSYTMDPKTASWRHTDEATLARAALALTLPAPSSSLCSSGL